MSDWVKSREREEFLLEHQAPKDRSREKVCISILCWSFFSVSIAWIFWVGWDMWPVESSKWNEFSNALSAPIGLLGAAAVVYSFRYVARQLRMRENENRRREAPHVYVGCSLVIKDLFRDTIHEEIQGSLSLRVVCRNIGAVASFLRGQVSLKAKGERQDGGTQISTIPVKKRFGADRIETDSPLVYEWEVPIADAGRFIKAIFYEQDKVEPYYEARIEIGVFCRMNLRYEGSRTLTWTAESARDQLDHDDRGNVVSPEMEREKLSDIIGNSQGKGGFDFDAFTRGLRAAKGVYLRPVIRRDT